VAKEIGAGIQTTGTADDNAQVELRQSTPQPFASEMFRPGAQGDVGIPGSGGTAKDGVRGGAQVQQVVVIPAAAKRTDGAVGRGDLAVGRHGHVDNHVGQGSACSGTRSLR